MRLVSMGSARGLPFDPLIAFKTSVPPMKKQRADYPFEDLAGRCYGRWTVLSRNPSHERKITWLCRCSCGNEKIVHGGNLKSGRSKSCGCLNKEVAFATATARWRGRRENSIPSSDSTAAAPTASPLLAPTIPASTGRAHQPTGRGSGNFHLPSSTSGRGR